MNELDLTVDTIHIVESLEQGRTGYRLFEDLEPLGIHSRPPIDVRFWPARSALDFIDTLDQIATDALRNERRPLLHIEAHGSVQGIRTASHEFLRWVDFAEELTAINHATRMNLIVVLAACDGVWLLQSLQPVGRAAFALLIGPNRVVYDREIETASSAFYRTLLAAHSITEALHSMNESIGSLRARTFVPVTAPAAFQGVFSHYVAESTGEDLEKRAFRIFQTVDESQFSKFERDVRRGNLMWRLRDHRRHFEYLDGGFSLSIGFRRTRSGFHSHSRTAPRT